MLVDMLPHALPASLAGHASSLYALYEAWVGAVRRLCRKHALPG